MLGNLLGDVRHVGGLPRENICVLMQEQREGCLHLRRHADTYADKPVDVVRVNLNRLGVIT